MGGGRKLSILLSKKLVDNTMKKKVVNYVANKDGRQHCEEVVIVLPTKMASNSVRKKVVNFVANEDGRQRL